MPGLVPAVDRAVRAAYALRGAADEGALGVLRRDAIEAADAFTAAAARHFA